MGQPLVFLKENYSLVVSVINTNTVYVIPKNYPVFDYLCQIAFISQGNELVYDTIFNDLFENGFDWYAE